MIARLMLRNDRSTIYLFLWMEGEVVVNLENWSYPWPSLFGFWNGKKFWGDIDYNEETKELIAECSDNDTLTTSIKENMRIAPVIVPPSHDLGYWKDNNLIEYSQINTAGQQDMYLSGYAESTCCGYLGEGAELVPEEIENYCPSSYPKKGRGIVAPIPVEDVVYIPSLQENYCPGRYPQQGRGIMAPRPVEDIVRIPSIPVRNPSMPVVENFDNAGNIIRDNQSGWVNTACGYNPKQVYESGLPSNLPAGNCEQNPALKQYNKNLFTQTVTPGVYTYNQVNEPINANIGISFQQQFEPVTCKRDERGLHYVQHDPRIIEPVERAPENPVVEKARYDNVYDPRFYGYGTSYRSYIDPQLGQPRFMYDDINAIRMPNYVTRSKIDHLPYADSYGPVQAGSEMGNIHNPNIRALAQDSFLRDSLEFRNDMTERLMRKINSESWQKRSAPNGNRPVGSYRRI
jgi:hypothetical protein